MPIDRVVICQASNIAARRVASEGDHMLFTCGSLPEGTDTVIPLSGVAEALGTEQFARIQEWLSIRVSSLPLDLRASVLAQLPFLASWASVQRQFARRLELTLDGARPKRLVGAYLPALQRQVALSYAMSRNVDFTVAESSLGRLRKHLPPLIHAKRALRAVQNRLQAMRTASEFGNTPELLVVSLQPNSTRSFLPVARQLAAAGRSIAFLLQVSDARSMAWVQEAGFPADVIDRRSRTADVGWAYASAAGFCRDAGPDGLLDLLERMDLPGWVDLPPLVPLLTRPFVRNLQTSCFQTRCIERSLQALDPRAVLFITNRAMMNELLASRADRTKRIFFLQGIVPEVPPISTRIDVDLAVVGSSLDKPYTDRCGVPDAVLRTTGYPDYDHYPQLSKEPCRRDAEALIPELRSKPLVVFTSQYATEVFPHWARRKNIKVLCAAARLLPDAIFLFKAHPLRESLDRDLLADFPPNMIVSPPFPTDRAIRAADVAVTYWSTTALESVLLGTPLVQINATGLPDYFDISGKLGRPTARTPDRLANMINELITSSDAISEFAAAREAFLTTFGIALDGQSAKRAANEIGQFL